MMQQRSQFYRQLTQSAKRATFIGLAAVWLASFHSSVKANGDDVRQSAEWRFERISEERILLGEQFITRDELLQQYSDRRLTIDPQSPLTLNTNYGCRFPFFRRVDVSMDSYWRQSGMFERYKTELLKANLPIGSAVDLILPNTSNFDCPDALQAIIEQDNYLILLDQGYLVFFRRESGSLIPARQDFNQYCFDPNKGRPYDGTSVDICRFPSMTILDVHQRFKTHVGGGYAAILKHAPEVMQNDSYQYHADDSETVYACTYEWNSPNNLTITLDLVGGIETTTFAFIQTDSVTTLKITSETGY
jgi:hypothetical protein